jgi:hypothetical protein
VLCITMTSPQSSAAVPSLARLMFDGGSYDGLALDRLPHSFGALKMPDGNRFVGQWEQGIFVLGQATRPGDLKCTGEVRWWIGLVLIVVFYCFPNIRLSLVTITNCTVWDLALIFLA